MGGKMGTVPLGSRKRGDWLGPRLGVEGPLWARRKPGGGGWAGLEEGGKGRKEAQFQGWG